VIVAPPLNAGATQLTTAVVLEATAVTPVGLSAVVHGVTGSDAADGRPSPSELDAITVNVYALPFASPEIGQLVVAEVHDSPPGDAVAVY